MFRRNSGHKLLHDAGYNNGFGLNEITKFILLKNGIEDSGLDTALSLARSNVNIQNSFHYFVVILSAEVPHKNLKHQSNLLLLLIIFNLKAACPMKKYMVTPLIYPSSSRTNGIHWNVGRWLGPAHSSGQRMAYNVLKVARPHFFTRSPSYGRRSKKLLRQRL